MLKIDLQLFGGRGTGSYTAGGGSGGMGGGESGGTDLPVAGWTADSAHRAVNKENTVRGVQNRIIDLNHEQMAIIGADGYVMAAVDGGKHSVGITTNAAKYVKGGDVIHNHPNGGSLSTTDVIVAGQTGAGSISAVSKSTGRSYTLRAGAKADGAGLANAMASAEGGLIDKWNAKISSMKGKRYNSEASYKKQVNYHWDRIVSDWMGTNASKYGYTYSVGRVGK